MHRILPITGLALVLSLSGCFISVKGDGDEDGYTVGSHDEIKQQEKRNRERLATMPLGLTLEQVVTQLGQPDFTEAFTAKGGEVRVLRYRTQRVHSDGDTSRDETTPLIFVGGKLTGIGDAAYARVLAEG